MVDKPNFSGLLIENLNSLFDAEKKQGEALIKIKKLAKSEKIIHFISDLQEMKIENLNRLQEIFDFLGLRPGKIKNNFVIELIHSGLKKAKKALEEDDDKSIVYGLQDIKQCDIANYGSAFTYANEMGEIEVSKLLKKNLESEIRAIENLSKIFLANNIVAFNYKENVISTN